MRAQPCGSWANPTSTRTPGGFCAGFKPVACASGPEGHPPRRLGPQARCRADTGADRVFGPRWLGAGGEGEGARPRSSGTAVGGQPEAPFFLTSMQKLQEMQKFTFLDAAAQFLQFLQFLHRGLRKNEIRAD